VKIGGVISISPEMTFYYGFKSSAFNIWPGESAWLEQYLPNIFSKLVTVPNAEMERLVSSQKDVFEPKWRQGVVKPREPLWHPHIAGVLCFE
jgi:hypothetical protein